MVKRLDDMAEADVDILEVMYDGEWVVLLGNDSDDFFDYAVVDLASWHPIIQLDAPWIRPVHNLTTLSNANWGSGEVINDTAIKSVKYWAGTCEK